jgi:hypothetical protein
MLKEVIVIHSWQEGLMWGIIFVVTCIGGYFTGKLRLSGRVSDFLKEQKKMIDNPDTDLRGGKLIMIQEVEDFLDGKKK